MSSEIVGLLGVGLLLLLICVGFPFAFAGAITGFLGLWYLVGSKPALTFIHRENQYRLSAIWQSRDSGQDVWGS